MICLGGIADFGFEGRSVAASPALVQIRKSLVLMLDDEYESVCHKGPYFIDIGLIVDRSSPADVVPVCVGVVKSELIGPKSA